MSQNPPHPEPEEFERSITSNIEPEHGWVQVEADYIVPRRFTSTIDSTEYPAVVTLDVEMSDDGKALCRGLSAQPRAGEYISTPTLRALPMKTLLRRAATAVMEKVELGPDGIVRRAPMEGSDVRDFSANYGRRRGGKRISEEQLRRVAKIYRAAKRSQDAAIRRAPTRTVARKLFVSRASAGRWVMAARKAGLLD